MAYFCRMKQFFWGLFFLPFCAMAQLLPKKKYPNGYFRDPLGIPISLAGNFGELRPNHFHSGLDIKTGHRENLPVYAAADGYISRIGVSNTGFGNVIYINHPNGYTTLYAHLNRFYPLLEEYVRQQQYKQESWKVELEIPKGLFPVKKGQFIAWSGNTGGSAGPHLHFEIRNTVTDKPLNGLLFGFPVADRVPPDLHRIAIYDANQSVYEQRPQLYAVRKVNGVYLPIPSKILVKTDRVAFGISATDRQTGSSNPNGIYEVILYEDGKANIGFQLDNIGYEETRYLNAHIDYKTKKAGGPYIEQVFSLPGNRLNIYHNLNGDGKIDLSDKKPHKISMEVKDAYGNTSLVRFQVQQDPSYDGNKATPCPNRMYPDSKNIFENSQVEFYLEEGSLYDSICFRYRELPPVLPNSYSGTYRLHTPLVPLHNYFTLRLRPTMAVPNNLKDKLVIVRTDRGTKEAVVTRLENGWYSGQFRAFGDFQLVADTVPPAIIPLGVHNGANLSGAARISFRLGDNLSGVNSYEARLDGQWLLFAQRGNVIYYLFDDHCPPGAHTLVVKVSDKAGNQSIYTLQFKR